ncbi:hypothetical protein Q1695_011506 [Nippostrongylus brasiliensis]|nr:hypothetical protein Q1695_011506 [Nippostrongylus brasiliensis]
MLSGRKKRRRKVSGGLSEDCVVEAGSSGGPSLLAEPEDGSTSHAGSSPSCSHFGNSSGFADDGEIAQACGGSRNRSCRIDPSEESAFMPLAEGCPQQTPPGPASRGDFDVLSSLTEDRERAAASTVSKENSRHTSTSTGSSGVIRTNPGCSRDKNRRPRRALPTIGTLERKEVLAEDAKRRYEEAAKRHRCPYCSYSAPFPSVVRRHITNKHNGSHVCSKCEKRFDNFSVLRCHIAEEHRKLHRCPHCSYSYKLLSEVRKHIKANHVNGVLCSVAGCNKRISRWRLKTHLKKEHHVSVEPCVSKKIVLATPAPTIADVRQSPTFMCSHCDFITSEVDDFNAHVMNAHEKGIMCPMPDCTVNVLLGDLDDHLHSVHNHDTVLPVNYTRRQDEFEESGYTSTSLPSVKQLASCSTASVSECVSTSYNSDVAFFDVGDGEAPEVPSFAKLTGGGIGLQCGFCGKNYRTSYLLKKHVKRVHDKAYAQYRRMRKHACSWEGCNKSFATPGLLEDHLNCHKGITPYCCKSCEVSFAARARFAVHLSKYHNMSIRDYTNVSELLSSGSSQ